MSSNAGNRNRRGAHAAPKGLTIIDTLQKELATLRKACPPEDLHTKRTACLRSFLDITWEEIHAQHTAGASGTEVVQALTRRVDTLVCLLYSEAVNDSVHPPPEGYAVLALGGYGRGALNPRSDIDLLFLFHRIREADPITRSILHTLWDLRFDIGYSTRTISDCLTAARGDTDSLTSMLEARLLVGDPNLVRRLEEVLVGQFFGRKARAFVARKIEERRQRHIKAGLSVQLLEPNVKENTGGLRDTHTVGWLLKVRRGLNAPEGLLQEHLITRRNYQLYVDALDFLWRTRNELHFSTGKRYDTLEHDLQPAIARGLGYMDGGHELGVERFMRDYYRHARNIKHLTDLICERLNGKFSAANRAVGLIARRTLDDGATLSHSHIELPRKRKSFFSDDPYRLLSLFLDAQRFGVLLNETTQSAIKGHLRLIDEAFRHSPRAARIFSDILGAPEGVATTLHTMHELGVLGAYIPEFDSLTCLVQYNRYHIYTADEHTLIALENLERLGTYPAVEGDLVHLKQVFNEISRKNLLYLALLLHDVGKSARGQDHSTVGARMARDFLKRLNLPSDQIDTVVFLVQNHLTMSHISQRRDLSDEAMLKEFARQFKHPDVLRMLYLLTYADLSSITRTAWTAWKAHLLRELYVKTFNLLILKGEPLREKDEYQAMDRHLVETLADRFGRHRLEAHLNNLPQRYADLTDLDGVATHLNLIEKLKKALVAVDVTRSGLFSEITICTRDKPYRLSKICGVLATNDINIFSAQAYTRTDGIVLDIFQITSVDGSPEIDSARQEQLHRQLTEVFAEKVSIENLLARHQQRWSRRRSPAIPIPTEVHFENDISNRYTVIDIFAQDAVGLLYKITRALSDLGLDIYTARISTQADKAVDSFYVTQNGNKIESSGALEHIQKEVLARIE